MISCWLLAAASLVSARRFLDLQKVYELVSRGTGHLSSKNNKMPEVPSNFVHGGLETRTLARRVPSGGSPGASCCLRPGDIAKDLGD